MSHGRSTSFQGVHQRAIILVLVGLFAVQTALIWTSSTSVAPGRGSLSTQALIGRQLYQDHNCTACHQLYGLGGYMGPDLTNVTRAQGKGPDYARGIILHGTQLMPAQQVTPAEAGHLVAYLDAWASSGTYPIRSFDLTPWGTYLQMNDDARD
jgi:nitric oxide reductase subunit C